jgi:hypothetical protein
VEKFKVTVKKLRTGEIKSVNKRKVESERVTGNV